VQVTVWLCNLVVYCPLVFLSLLSSISTFGEDFEDRLSHYSHQYDTEVLKVKGGTSQFIPVMM